MSIFPAAENRVTRKAVSYGPVHKAVWAHCIGLADRLYLGAPKLAGQRSVQIYRQPFAPKTGP